MRLVFAVDYNDGKVRAKADDVVPDSIPAHRIGVLTKAGMIKKPDDPSPHGEQIEAIAVAETEGERDPRDPFDHDGDGKPGGSLPKRKRGRK